jgi:DNA-nicking Smr family endonuclease
MPPGASSVRQKPASFDSAVAAQLRRGKMRVEARLDLHGMTQQEAYGALNRFISSCIASERRTLLVITGKGGVLEENKGVLRRMLPLWLEEPPLRDKVLAFVQAPRKDGGDGAFYIRLRKNTAE